MIFVINHLFNINVSIFGFCMLVSFSFLVCLSFVLWIFLRHFVIPYRIKQCLSIDPLLFLVISRSPKTRSQKIATFNLFQANPTFTFAFITYGILNTKLAASSLIDKQVKRNVLNPKKSVHVHSNFKHQNNKPSINFAILNFSQTSPVYFSSSLNIYEIKTTIAVSTYSFFFI